MSDAAPQSDVVDRTGKVTLVDPEGQLVRVPAENAAAALADGYSKPGDEQILESVNEQYFGGTAGTIEASVLGGLRGATLGLSDAALKGLGVASSEHLSTVREQSPTASLVSEIGGSVAGSFIGGAPAGLVARAGSVATKATGSALTGLAARGLAGRVAAKGLATAAGGALEGAAYGAAQAVDESVLGDTELTAEKVLAHAGWGAVIGGTAGGVLGGGLELGGAVAKKAAEKAAAKLGGGNVKEWLEQVSAESAVKATGARGADIQKLGTDEKVRQIGDDLRNYTTKDGEKVLQFGDKADDLLPRIKKAKGEVTNDLGDLRAKVDDFVRKNPGEAWDVGEYLANVRKEVLEPLYESGVPSVRAKGKKVLRELGPLQKAWGDGRKLSPKTLTKLRQDLADVVYPKRPPGGGLPPQPPAHAAELMKAERLLEDFIEKNTDLAAQKMGGEAMAGRYKELRRLSESFIKAEKLAEKASKQDLGNRSPFSLTDYLSGGFGGVAAATLGVPAMITAAGAAVGNKLLRERGRAVASIVADKAARLRILQGASQSFDAQVTKAVDAFIAKSGTAALRAVPGAMRAIQETPIAAPLRRVAGDKQDDRRTAYKKRIAELRDLSTNPEGVSKRLATSLRHVVDAAPNVATLVQAKTSQAAKFLIDKAPKNPMPPTGFSVMREWEPSDSEIAKWSRYYEAVSNPMSVLDGLRSGTISQEGVEALKVVYPKLYDYVKRKVIERVSEVDTPPPYRDRISLSILFDVPLDPTMRPEFIGMVKAQHEAQQQQQPPQQGGGSGSAQSKYAAALMTPSQRLLER